jgi:hypothetical protein
LVSILATPATGWTIGGYHVTSGVNCGEQAGYFCSFTMPNFPVTFQVTFAETTTTTVLIVTTSSTTQTGTTSTIIVGSTVTSTITMTSVSTTQAVGVVTTSVYSTTNITQLETESNVLTASSTLTATTISVAMTLENPPVELGLALVILLAATGVGIAMIRRSPRGGPLSCASCGFKNHPGVKFCESCGQPLRRG